jgi:uridylate kinase
MNKTKLKIQEDFLADKAQEISQSELFKGEPPVIVIVGGKGTKNDANEPKRLIWGEYNVSRLRDRIGILQTTIQYATLRHEFGRSLNNIQKLGIRAKYYLCKYLRIR